MDKKLDLRVIKTYRALTDSLKYLLSKKSLNEITVNEICERAVIRRTTFYKHFSDKYELLLFVIREIQEDIDRKAKEMRNSSNEGRQDFYYHILYLFEYVEENKVLFGSLKNSCSSVFVMESLMGNVVDETRTYLVKSARDQEFSAAYLDLTSQLLTGALLQSLNWWLSHMEQFTRYEMTEQVCTFLTNAAGDMIDPYRCSGNNTSSVV